MLIGVLETLDQEIVACRRCPRLVEWREQVAREKRRAFMDWSYWGKPVPNFGDPEASHLIVGLAPAAHGANRTGQMFTGDRSGDWLFRALHRVGVANRPKADSIADGLRLTGVLITAIVHCAPPDNKPLPSERANCAGYFERLLRSRTWESMLCLGGLAWQATHRALGVRAPAFRHGAIHEVATIRLVGSYHPSQQNTFTGRLTEAMLDGAIREFLGVK